MERDPMGLLLGIVRLAGHHGSIVMLLAITSHGYHRVGLRPEGSALAFSVAHDATVVGLSFHPRTITRFDSTAEPEDIVLGSVADRHDRRLIMTATNGMGLPTH